MSMLKRLLRDENGATAIEYGLIAAGISVAWLRYRAVLICGLLTGIAGAYISIAQNAAFSRDMTAGQGYIALAAMIFGKWKPVPALGACLMFGLLDAVAIIAVVKGVGTDLNTNFTSVQNGLK